MVQQRNIGTGPTVDYQTNRLIAVCVQENENISLEGALEKIQSRFKHCVNLQQTPISCQELNLGRYKLCGGISKLSKKDSRNNHSVKLSCEHSSQLVVKKVERIKLFRRVK